LAGICKLGKNVVFRERRRRGEKRLKEKQKGKEIKEGVFAGSKRIFQSKGQPAIVGKKRGELNGIRSG